MGIGGEQGVVLGADGAPGGAEVGHGSGAVGEDDVEVGFGADLRAFGFGGGIYQFRRKEKVDGAPGVRKPEQDRGIAGEEGRAWSEGKVTYRAAGKAVAFGEGSVTGFDGITKGLGGVEKEEIAREPDNLAAGIAWPSEGGKGGKGETGELLAKGSGVCGEGGGSGRGRGRPR